MYQQHFNFTAPPFSIAPNPRYVYLSPQHREALAHLLYGISVGGGFIVLTGEVGTGKTTLCRCLIEQLPEDVDIALIFNPRLNARELLATICDELRISHPGEKTSIKRLIDLLNRHLLDAHARGRRTIALIDEAQNLTHDVLEQIRLLTNLETNETKLLQIILVGQPELRRLLNRQSLRQLSQRITARYHLLPLSLDETEAYIQHRLAVSGVTRKIFSRPAVRRVYRLSEGIPRLINLICDRALLGAYTLGRIQVNADIVGKAASEVLPEKQGRRAAVAVAVAATAALASLAVAVGLAFDLPQKMPFQVPLFLGKTRDKPEGEWQTAKTGGLTPEKSRTESHETEARSRPADAPARTSPGTSGNEAKPPPDASGPPTPGNAKPTSQTEPASTLDSATAEAKPDETGNLQSIADADFQKLIVNPALNRRSAFARLFALWGVDAPDGALDECAAAQIAGLRCLFSRGDLSLLRNLDLPALIELVLTDGSKRYATLLGFENQQSVLGLDELTLGLETERLLPYWSGNFILLWKPSSSATGVMKLGKDSEGIRWVRQRLNAPATMGRDSVFDLELKQRVIEFQHRHGLPGDGEVGPLTLIAIEKSTGQYDGPSLASNKHRIR